MTPSPGIEPGPPWWEASALTTAPPLLIRVFDQKIIQQNMAEKGMNLGLKY